MNHKLYDFDALELKCSGNSWKRTIRFLKDANNSDPLVEELQQSTCEEDRPSYISELLSDAPLTVRPERVNCLVSRTYSSRERELTDLLNNLQISPTQQDAPVDDNNGEINQMEAPKLFIDDLKGTEWSKLSRFFRTYKDCEKICQRFDIPETTLLNMRCSSEPALSRCKAILQSLVRCKPEETIDCFLQTLEKSRIQCFTEAASAIRERFASHEVHGKAYLKDQKIYFNFIAAEICRKSSLDWKVVGGRYFDKLDVQSVESKIEINSSFGDQLLKHWDGNRITLSDLENRLRGIRSDAANYIRTILDDRRQNLPFA